MHWRMGSSDIGSAIALSAYVTAVWREPISLPGSTWCIKVVACRIGVDDVVFLKLIRVFIGCGCGSELEMLKIHNFWGEDNVIT